MISPDMPSIPAGVCLGVDVGGDRIRRTWEFLAPATASPSRRPAAADGEVPAHIEPEPKASPPQADAKA